VLLHDAPGKFWAKFLAVGLGHPKIFLDRRQLGDISHLKKIGRANAQTGVQEKFNSQMAAKVGSASMDTSPDASLESSEHVESSKVSLWLSPSLPPDFRVLAVDEKKKQVVYQVHKAMIMQSEVLRTLPGASSLAEIDWSEFKHVQPFLSLLYVVHVPQHDVKPSEALTSFLEQQAASKRLKLDAEAFQGVISIAHRYHFALLLSVLEDVWLKQQLNDWKTGPTGMNELVAAANFAGSLKLDSLPVLVQHIYLATLGEGAPGLHGMAAMAYKCVFARLRV
jgi:hypothetical protein